MSQHTHAAEPGTLDPVVLAVDIVGSFVRNNHVPQAELAGLIQRTHAALVGLVAGPEPVEAGPPKASPEEIRRSIGHDRLISFEDGQPYKTLRRHLTLRGLSPEAYRAKWGLPRDYPMTCRSYSETRSALAKQHALGRPAPVQAAPEADPARAAA